jgi:hypothetical protein
VKKVLAPITGNAVIPTASIEDVSLVSTADQIIAGPCTDVVKARSTCYHIVSTGAKDHVIACRAGDRWDLPQTLIGSLSERHIQAK